METVKSVTVGWTLGAFISASLDSIFNTPAIAEKSPVLAGLAALGELSLAVIIIKGVSGRFVFSGTMTAWEVSAWLMPLAFFTPRATKTLTDNYYQFHRFLYNTDTLPDACCSDCAK